MIETRDFFKIPEECTVKSYLELYGYNFDNALDPKYPKTDFVNEATLECYARNRFIEDLGYVRYAWKWIRPLADFLKGKKCLEVMAGSGALSFALNKLGVDCICTDDMSWKNNAQATWRIYDRLISINANEAIRTYGKDVDYVIMGWPPYNKSYAADVVKTIQEVNPDLPIIYIGEDCGGCTADDEFFDITRDVDYPEFDGINQFHPEFEGINKFYIPWGGINDAIRVLKFDPTPWLVD